jgi:hypothetical protein
MNKGHFHLRCLHKLLNVPVEAAKAHNRAVDTLTVMVCCDLLLFLYTVLWCVVWRMVFYVARWKHLGLALSFDDVLSVLVSLET